MKVNSQKVSFKSLPAKARILSSKMLAGARPHFSDMKSLKKEGITQIIDLCTRFSLPKLKERFLCFLCGIKYISAPMSIHKKLPNKEFFERIANIIKSHKGKTYVHCVSGSHRTNLVTFATLLFNEGENPQNLIPFLKKYNFFNLCPKKENMIAFRERLKEFQEMFCK